MLVVGHKKAYRRDSTGHRINGWWLYGLSRVEGTIGYIPVSTFIAIKDYALDYPPIESLIGYRVKVLKDHLDRLAEFKVITPQERKK